MTCNPVDIAQHLIEHEILGVSASGGGSISGFQIDNDRAWIYDSSRSKWLSSDRLTASAGRKGRAKNTYLRLIDGQASSLTGYRLVREATLVAISAQTRVSETWTLHVRKNGVDTNLASLAMTSETGSHDTTINLDLNEGDFIQFYAETTSLLGIRDPFIWAELAWRHPTL